MISLINILSNVRKGVWNVYITKNHSSIGSQPLLEYNCTEMDSIGVDTGQVGIYDLAYYRDDNIVRGYPSASSITSSDRGEHWYKVNSYMTGREPRTGVIPHGAISSSGYGDGVYPVNILYDNSQIVGVWIDFSE